MTGIRRDIGIGPCRLILGDMREVLPLLDARPRLCLTDPPYRLTPGGNSTGEMKGCFARDAYDNSGALFEMVDWAEMAPLIHDALTENADAIVMSSDRELALAAQCFAHARFGFHRVLVWDKITATPNRWYMPNCEFALYLYKGRARTIADPASKALIRCPQRDVSQHYLPDGAGRAHPTEKPVSLMQHWLCNSTRRGETVIDPFMGSGSTLVAAVRAGRSAIGIEADPHWFEVACARVRAALESGQADMVFTGQEGQKQEGFAI